MTSYEEPEMFKHLFQELVIQFQNTTDDGTLFFLILFPQINNVWTLKLKNSLFTSDDVHLFILFCLFYVWVTVSQVADVLP